MYYSSTKHKHLISQHERLFRGFIKNHGRVKLRRLLHALDRNHTTAAIAHQLDVPGDEIKLIYSLRRFTS